MTRSRLTVCLGAVACLVAAACSTTGSGRDRPRLAGGTAPTSTNLAPPGGASTKTGPDQGSHPPAAGPFDVVTEDLSLADPTRPTAANNGVAAHSGRLLATRLYLPAHNGVPAVGDGPFPLFVWSHGVSATVAAFDSLLRAWSGDGYVVAAPTFPLTSATAPGGPRYGDYVNQPADVSFVINQILHRDGPDGVEHRGLVDGSRIGAGGHSLGAVTTVALVANRCCGDTRIRAAVAIDGAPLPFPGGGEDERGVPLLLIHGDADTTFPVQDSRDAFTHAAPPKYLMVLHGAPHTPFAVPAMKALIVTTVADFLDVYLKSQPGAGNRLRRDAAVPGFSTLSAAP